MNAYESMMAETMQHAPALVSAQVIKGDIHE